MIDEPKPMKEVHEIRERLHKKTKSMTNREFIDYLHQSTEDAEKKYGLKLRRLSKYCRAA